MPMIERTSGCEYLKRGLLLSTLAVSLAVSLSLAHADEAASGSSDVTAPQLVDADAFDGAMGSGDVPDMVGDINGVVNIRRILDGRTSSTNQWPSTVAILSAGFTPPFSRQICGGTVIASRWVLTAAHCLFNVFDRVKTPGSLRVVAGVTNLVEEPIDEELVVTNIYVHPQYDHRGSLNYYDIGLLELATDMASPPVEIYTGSVENLVGATGAIVGWGTTFYLDEENFAPATGVQNFGLVPLVSLADCNAPVSYDGELASGQFCAGFVTGGVDSCIGDSGGPLFVEVDGRKRQVGVTSYGRGCGFPGFYGVYTDVSSYRNWLANYVEVPEADLTETIVSGPTPRTIGLGSGDSSSSGSAGWGLLGLLGSPLLARRRFGVHQQAQAGEPVNGASG